MSCLNGHPHIWEAAPSARSRGAGCPYCSGKKVCKHNSFVEKAPEVLAMWHPERNLPILPETLTAYSHYRAHWHCPACNHNWRCKVSQKVAYNSGCPECSKATTGYDKHGVRKKRPSFASINHYLLSQWDHRLNEREGIHPANTTLGSMKLTWWTCDQCSCGKKHSWKARAGSRTSGRLPGCPYCAGRRVCECNSLETLYPDIAADFDIVTNCLTPAQVTASSYKRYRWLSDKPGAKLRSPQQRINHRRAQKRLARQKAAIDGA